MENPDETIPAWLRELDHRLKATRNRRVEAKCQKETARIDRLREDTRQCERFVAGLRPAFEAILPAAEAAYREFLVSVEWRYLLHAFGEDANVKLPTIRVSPDKGTIAELEWDHGGNGYPSGNPTWYVGRLLRLSTHYGLSRRRDNLLVANSLREACQLKLSAGTGAREVALCVKFLLDFLAAGRLQEGARLCIAGKVSGEEWVTSREEMKH